MLSNTTVSNESLDSAQWEPVGFGGFGHVFKARHKDWGFDVAIKIPHRYVNLSILYLYLPGTKQMFAKCIDICILSSAWRTLMSLSLYKSTLKN